MRQVSSVREVHSKEGITGLEGGEENGGIGLRSGMGLDVRIRGAEDLLRAINSKRLDGIGLLASVVVALFWITLGLFVRQRRRIGLKNAAADEVL